MPHQQAVTNNTHEFAQWILNISDGTNTSSKGEELIKIATDILLKKGDCGEHISKFVGNVLPAGFLRRKSKIMSKEQNSSQD